MFCEKCGKEIVDTSGKCLECETAISKSEMPMPETASQDSQRSFCEHCGAQITKNTSICMSCGCETSFVKQSSKSKSIKKSFDKRVMILSVIIVALVITILAGTILVNVVRRAEVKNQLAGQDFEYYDYNLYSYREERLSFDENAQCTYCYYFSNVMEEEIEYTKDYEIKFEDGMTFLVMGIDTFEVQYDKYGRIDSLYDIDSKEVFD